MKFNFKRIFALLVLLIFAALIFLPLIGCGAKKTESTKKEEITKTDFSGFFRNSGNSHEILNSDFNFNVSSVFKVDDQNEIITTTKTVKPINPLIPAVYKDDKGVKHELNNTSYTEETKIEKNNKKSENSEISENSGKTSIEKKDSNNAEIEISQKGSTSKLDESDKSDRKNWAIPISYILAFLIFILLVLWYLNYRYQWVNHVTTFIAGLFQIRKK